MIQAIEITGAVFWTLTYVLIARRGHLDRTYGMPLVALCANISWEFIFAFLYHPGSDSPHRYIHIAWFSLDVIILFQLLKYGPREFPRLSGRVFYSVFGLALLTSFCTILFATYDAADRAGIYAAFGQNMLMSVLFIVMLYDRRSLRGQSLPIAICKMLGTVLYSLPLWIRLLDEYPSSLWLPYMAGYTTKFMDSPGSDVYFLLLFLSVAILLFDLIYIAMVWAQSGVEAKAER